MKYSAEYAIFHAAFQLFEKEVSSAKLELVNLSKKDARRFTHIIRGAVEDICCGIREENFALIKQHWHFNLHLVLFLKLFCQEKLQDTSEKFYQDAPCKDDMLIIMAPLPHISTAFYFELLKSCAWQLLFSACLPMLESEEIQKLMVHAIKHCQEEPQSKEDLFLLTALIKIINESCLPDEIQKFWSKHREAGRLIDASGPHISLSNVRNMLSDHNQILLDLLNGVEQLLTCINKEAENRGSSVWDLEEAKNSDSLFRNIYELSNFDDIYFDLTFLGVALYGDSFKTAITLKDLFTEKQLYNLEKGELLNLTEDLKKWLDKSDDIESLKNLHENGTKYSALKCKPYPFIVEHLKTLKSEYPRRIISCLYLYLKCQPCLEDEKTLKDQKLLSADKFMRLCCILVGYLSDNEDYSAYGDMIPEGDFFIDQCDFINDYDITCDDSFDEYQGRTTPTIPMEDGLPVDKLAEILKDGNLYSWQDGSYLILEDHLRELTDADLFRSLWERVNWLSNFRGEAEDLTKDYLKILLDAFSLLDPLLQDYFIRDFYLPNKIDAVRPWWRNDGSQQQLALSLNKLTERNFSKIPNRISHYALLDLDTVLRTSIFTAVNNACQVDVIVQLLRFLPVSCQIPSSCHNTDNEEKKDVKSLSLLGEVLETVLNSGKLDENQQNAFLELVTQLIKPVSTGVRKQFGVTKHLLRVSEVFHFHILPRLHLNFPLDANQPNPVFILQLLLIVLESEQIQHSTCIEGLHLHVVIVQICHALNSSIETWKEVGKKEFFWKMKPLLISALGLLQEIILKNLPANPDKICEWLNHKLSILDWTVRLRVRNLLFLKHQNSEPDQQLSDKMVLSFLKTHGITQTCDLQQTLHLLRLASIDEELCTSVIRSLPPYILFSRDCVTTAFAQLLPNFLPAEGLLVCQFLMHLLENNQLIVLFQASFLPSIPCLDLSVLKSYLGLSQLFLDVIVLQVGLDTAILQYVFDNVFIFTKNVLLSPAILSQLSPMLALLLIYQIFSMMNLLLKIAEHLNPGKIFLFLVELIAIFNQHFSMFHPVPKKRKHGITKDEESESSRDKTLELNPNEDAGASTEDVSSEDMPASMPDKFHVALVLELLTSMIDRVNNLSNNEIKNSIIIKLEEMKQPFLKVCKKIK